MSEEKGYMKMDLARVTLAQLLKGLPATSDAPDDLTVEDAVIFPDSGHIITLKIGSKEFPQPVDGRSLEEHPGFEFETIEFDDLREEIKHKDAIIGTLTAAVEQTAKMKESYSKPWNFIGRWFADYPAEMNHLFLVLFVLASWGIVCLFI